MKCLAFDKRTPTPIVREGYLDWLRIVAAAMVVAIHTLGYFLLKNVPVSGSGFVDVGRYVVRSAVPVFFMVSGALWLSPEFEFSSKRLAKALARLVLIYFVWNLIYALVFDYGSYSLFGLLKHTWKGHFHMWFFEYLIGVYLLIPILRLVVCYNNGSILPYVVALFLVFGILCPTANSLSVFNEEIRLITGKIHYELIGFSGYFLVGYWLGSRKCKIGCIALSTIFLLAVASHYMAGSCGFIHSVDSDSFSMFVFAEACSIFLIFVHLVGKRTPPAIVLTLSGVTLGVYLMHPFFVEKISWEWLMDFPEPAAWLLMFTIVLLSSAATTLILKKIPILNKWLV